MADINIGGTFHSTATGNIVARADEIQDTSKNKKQNTINAEIDTALADRYTKSETYSKTELNNLITTPNQQYVTVATYAGLPATGSADTVYRVANYDGGTSAIDATKYSEYAWNGSVYILLAVKPAIAEVFDVSEYNATGGTYATYAGIAEAATATPQAKRASGMTIKYLDSTTNKYIEYRYLNQYANTTAGNNAFVNTANWEKINNVSISQNTSTGHTDINIGSDSYSVASAEEVNQLGQEKADIEYLSYPVVTGIKIPGELKSDGTFGTNATTFHKAIPAKPGQKYCIRSTRVSGTSKASYAFATSSNCTLGGQIPLVTGTAVHFLTPNTSEIATIPDGCSYLLVGYYTATNNPFDVKYAGFDKVPIEGRNNAPVSSGGVYDLFRKLFIQSTQDITDYSAESYSLTVNNIYGTSSTSKHAAIQVTEGEIYIITSSDNTSTRYAFATEKGTPAASGNIPLVQDTFVVELEANDSVYVLIPSGCNYLFVNYGSGYPLNVKKFTKDSEPTYGSQAFVESGGIFNAVSYNYGYDIESGSINYQTGAAQTDGTRARTVSPILVNWLKNAFIEANSGYKYSYRFYDASGNYISADYTSWKTGFNKVVPVEGAYSMRLVLAYSNDATISDLDDIKDNIFLRMSSNDSLDWLCDIEKSLVKKVDDNEEIINLSDFTLGYINVNTGVVSSSTYIVYSKLFTLANIKRLEVDSGYLITLRYYNASGEFIYVNNTWKSNGNIPVVENAVYLRVLAKRSDDSTISTSDFAEIESHVRMVYYLTGMVSEDNSAIKRLAATSGTELINYTFPAKTPIIHTAKEHTFSDGTQPLLEWFLIEDYATHKFYYSKDLQSRRELFTFNSYGYQMGILSNGDIIAVRLAENITAETQSDDNRTNPFVWKASEKWATQHEVDFGSSLKPCGWLSSKGFRLLPDGTCMFGEYTRPTVSTSNIWKITGDALNPSNWVVKKTFSPIGGDGDNMYKHIHSINYDHYTGVIYCTTGDVDTYAQIWYTLDGGDTWIEIEKNASLNNGQQYRLCNMTFTPDYIVWGTDTPGANKHVVYIGERDANGVLDKDTLRLLCDFTTQDGNVSSYGQAYLAEYDAIFLFDRQDGGGTQANHVPIYVVELSDGSKHQVADLKPIGSTTTIGFRCKFKEWYPINGVIRVGFAHGANYNAVCDNSSLAPIDNLVLYVKKDGTRWTCRFTTCYV